MEFFNDLDVRKKALEKFVFQNKPELIAKLDEFKKEIISLNEMGYSLDQILDFLREQGIDIFKPTLAFFIEIQYSPNKIQEKIR